MAPLLTQDQVRALCVKAGFSAADARIASAIAMVEAPASTGGKSYSDCGLIGDQALANDTWGYSYGCFQIRSRRADRGTGKSRDELKLPDPEFNARAALAVFRDQGWGAWSTYNTGQYRAYLQDLYPPPPGVYVVIGGDSLSGIASKLGLGSWTQLARVNGLHSPYLIFIGQKLLLPFFSYTVQPGDTLSAIVTRYSEGVTVARVVEFNALTNPDLITPGQVLRIPHPSL